MKFFYDARWVLTDGRVDGISRYSLELARALASRAAATGDTPVWLVCESAQLDLLPAGEFVLLNDPNDFWRELFIARALNAAGAKIVYSPFFVMGSLGRRYQLVLTIHDLIYFQFRTPPQWLSWPVRLAWRLFHLSFAPLRWQLGRAARVATVSETARDQLVAARVTRGLPPVVVSNGCADVFATGSARDTAPRDGASSVAVSAGGRSSAVRSSTSDVGDSATVTERARSCAESREILYMGAFTPYKNVECLLRALQFMPEITLHLLARVPASREARLRSLAVSLGVAERVVWHGGVSDDAYVELLARVRCSVSASRVEGFGLPVIEAQRSGVPFAAADTPIFREVSGGAAIFFDADDPEQLAARVRELADPGRVQKLISAGFKNAAGYTWSASADAALALMRSL